MNRKWLVLIGTGIGGVLIGVDYSIVNTSLAPIQKELHASVNQLQWIINGFGLFFSTFLVATGRFGDLRGRRKLFYIGTIGFALTSLGAGLADTSKFLIMMRILQGFLGSAIFPCGMAISADAFPEPEKSRAISIYNSFIGFGFAAGPVLGSFIVTLLGWRWIFFINLPVMFVSFLICLFVVRESKQVDAPPVDWLGVISLSAFLGLLLLTIDDISLSGRNLPFIAIPAILSVVALIIFIFVEKRTKSPLIPLEMFMNTGFLLGMITFITGTSISWSVIFMMPLYLHQSVGLTTGIVGIVLFAMTIMTMIAPSVSGYYFDKTNPKPTIIALFFFALVSLLMFMLLRNDGPMWLIILSFILFGAAWGTSNGISIPLGLSKLPDFENSGLISGSMLTLMNIIGMVILAFNAVIIERGQKISFLHGVHLASMTLLIIAIVLLVMVIPVVRQYMRSV
ncbi:MAG: MFS transporter [Pseudomonadota bacterium]